jgi:hypothetical protein
MGSTLGKMGGLVGVVVNRAGRSAQARGRSGARLIDGIGGFAPKVGGF